MDKKGANKAIEGLIDTWEVQLGSGYDKLKLKDGEKFYISQKMNGCFTKNTPVIMGDGSKKKICDVKVGDIVKSFNEDTKKIENKKVVNVFFNGRKPANEWTRIDCEDVRGKAYKSYINVTNNHRIFTPYGWKEAGEIKVGDYVYVMEYELSDTQKSVLLGIGLGDANVQKDNKELPVVRFKYPKKINGYSNFLHQVGGLFDVYEGTYDKRISGYGTEMETITIKSIYNIPRAFTDNKNILRAGYTFTEDILENITPLTLALLYIDDGNRDGCQKDGYNVKNVNPRVTIATHRHKKEDVVRFSNFLIEKYGITNRFVRYSRSKQSEDEGYQIEIDVNGTKKLFDLIAKYIPYELRKQKLSKDWMDVPYEDWTKDIGEYKLIKKLVVNKDKKKDFFINTPCMQQIIMLF